MASGPIYLRCVRVRNLPNHPEHPDGHVRMTFDPDPRLSIPLGNLSVLPSDQRPITSLQHAMLMTTSLLPPATQHPQSSPVAQSEAKNDEPLSCTFSDVLFPFSRLFLFLFHPPFLFLSLFNFFSSSSSVRSVTFRPFCSTMCLKVTR